MSTDAKNNAADGTSEDPAAVLRERDELRDQLQRTLAEFMNFQKRSKAAADEERKYAISRVALDLIAVMDNFERAIDAARAANATGIVDGLEMVHKQLLASLAKHGVEPIVAMGQPFNPNFHEAIMRKPSAEAPEDSVVMDLEKGYKIFDRVLRPSKVAVAVKSTEG